MATDTEKVEPQGGLTAQVASLRQAFDQGFANPTTLIQESEDLVLVVRIAARSYGVRLSEIAGIHRCPKIVQLPGSKRVCLGIVGLRGRLHAAFHLGLLLGVPAATSTPRWLVLAPGRNAPSFAVEAIESCVPIRTEDMRAIEDVSKEKTHTHALFIHEGTTRELLHVPSLVAVTTGDSAISRAIG